MPFLAPALPWLLGLGSATGSVAAARAAGRATDARTQQEQDQLSQNAARINLQAPSQRAHNAVRGDILANAKDFSYGAPTMVGNIPVPTSTGGLRPSIFSPATRQLGSTISSQALDQQQTNGGNAASVTPLPQPNMLDKILGIAGTIGGLGAGVQDAQGLRSSLPYRRRPNGNPTDTSDDI